MVDADTLRKQLSELRDIHTHKKNLSEKTSLDVERSKTNENTLLGERARLMAMHERALETERSCAADVAMCASLLQTAQMLVPDGSQLPTAPRIAAGP